MEKFPQKSLEADKKDSSPFPVDRISWTDEDFERHHRAMKSLPCIRGHEAFREVIGALSQLVEYHEDEGTPFWKASVQTFEPRQVVMRYGGEDWSYAFHQQLKYGERTGERESSVTGIAKKIVKEVPKLVRSYKRQIDAAEPQERTPLENELVAKVEDIFAAIYHSDDRAGSVAVEKIPGPRGPVYMTHDGNHRLAAARLIDLKRVRGIVKEPQKDSLGNDFWYELLAILPPKQSRKLEGLYNGLYPADETALKKDREQLEKAKARLPKIQLVVEKKRSERMAEARKRDEEWNKEKEVVEKNYALIDRIYSSLEGKPGFQETLCREGLDYIWNHPSFFKYRKKYKKEISTTGWVPSSDGGGGDFHLFGFDLDIYPRRTEDEIKFRAIQTYIKEHPELRSLIQSRSRSGL